MNPLVSIIIPVYNVEPYISEALDSVLRQSYNNLEILLIDDGSTDSSGTICDLYAEQDSRFKVIHQTYAGVSAARNAGLDHMTGEVVAFLDPDDIYCPEFIQKMLDTMLCEKSDIVVCNYTIVSDGNQTICHDLSPKLFDRIGALNALIDGIYDWSVWNKMYDRVLWEGIRFPEGQVYEDLDVLYKVIDRCGRLYTLPEPLYIKQKRPGSITTTFSKENIRGLLTAHAHYAEFVKEHVTSVFTEEQYRRISEWNIRTQIFSYVLYNRTFGEDEFLIRLKSEIREAHVKNFSPGVKMACWMMRHCPWLLIRVYSFRGAIKRLFSR